MTNENKQSISPTIEQLSSLSPESLQSLSKSDLIALHEDLKQLQLTQSREKLKNYKPYPKQAEFHELSQENRERLLMAANQSGKSYCGCMELAIHLTGNYPDWWKGRKFEAPIRAWCGSETAEVTRDTQQRLLIGEPKDKSQYGSGALPFDTLPDFYKVQGDRGWTAGTVPDAIGTLLVKHISGGNSTLGFKNYQQARERWQGETLDLVYFDEEPPMDLYVEGLTRTNATEGITYITFTPIKGISDVVLMFMKDAGML